MSMPLQILLAEDSPTDAALLMRAVRKAGFEFTHQIVDNEQDYLRGLDSRPDIIISDYEMPQFGGIRALQLLRESGLEIPFIIVSGNIGEDLAVEVMKQGATDYLLKDRLARLGTSITQALEKGRLRKEGGKVIEALRESEERFRQVVQNIDQVFWMTNLDKTEMLFVSAAYEKIWGRSCASLYASPMTWAEAIHPDDRERILQAAGQRQGLGAYHEEYRVVRPDGSVRWISDRAFPVRDASGAVYRIAGIANDITERRQAEADLQLFRNLVDQSNDTFEVIDPETARFLDVNAKGLTDLGYTREEYLSLRVPDIDPLVQDEQWKSLAERMGRGEVATGEGIHVRKDGSSFPVEFNSKWVQLERPYIIASIRDISERKRAEERAHEQAAMLDLAHDAIVIRGFQDRLITYWNKGAERLYGWSAGEAIGRGIDELIFLNPDRIELVNSELLKADEWRGENHHTSKSGKKLVVSSRATLVRDAQGEPRSVFVINTDITEQKELEGRFLRAQRMESIGTLASGVAHDLNNILSPIMMSVPLLRHNLPPEVREEILSTIELSADRGAQIVKQVLTFGRGVEGERHPMQLAAVIKEVGKIVYETFPRDVEIDSELPPDLWMVVGDATQLHQVILNLCVNARDAMLSGGKLRLRARNVELDESYVSMLPGATLGPNILLEVEDTGTGIPAETIERIFDPFFTTKGIGKGTGLGLSTVLGIVKSHGGHIGVQSEVGVGTTFRIYLPAQASSSPAAETTRPGGGLPRGNGECVLVVDDEEHVRRTVRCALEAHGYQTLLASDGTDALASFAQNSGRVALVLTDLMMPYMDGVALIHALRRIRPDLPIIASTGLGRKRQLADLERLNVQAMLTKPYGSEALLTSIRAALNVVG